MYFLVSSKCVSNPKYYYTYKSAIALDIKRNFHVIKIGEKNYDQSFVFILVKYCKLNIVVYHTLFYYIMIYHLSILFYTRYRQYIHIILFVLHNKPR